tara:strand:- start:679 stop:804 length:126 start_codon:yes stop_codon:yes gene_type:complete
MRKPGKKKKATVKKKKTNGKKLTKAQQTLPPFLQKKIREKK